MRLYFFFFFFLKEEDGIRVLTVTGVQTCALPIYLRGGGGATRVEGGELEATADEMRVAVRESRHHEAAVRTHHAGARAEIAGDRRRVTHGQDLAPADRHGTGLRGAGRESGPHRAPLDDEVGGLAAGGERGTQQ